ncbi:hypothetical protein C8F01DRAFT_179634 [Mycena amicta]|nr:hypothetical protein C8F01DRAFT_179634 [Mycena amicta]
MKRARTENGPVYASRKSKAIQACTSCRKHKTRCELLDTTSDPVQCHRCQVIGIHCSYEETLLPSGVPDMPVAGGPISCTWSRWRKPKPDLPFPARPPPADRLWDFIAQERNPVDWSAPMLAMHNLARSDASEGGHPQAPSPPRDPILSLAEILSAEQIHQLLGIFDQRFTPWLNFKLIRQSNATLLDVICCTIAARFLPDLPVPAQQQLYALTEDLIVQMIVNTRISTSIEAVQALLILSLWEPVVQQQNTSSSEGRDARVLVASAVSMAMNMRLNQASAKAEGLRKAGHMAGGPLSAEDLVALEEMLEQARLWIAVVNAESMLCLGTGRVPLSRRSADDKKLVQFPEAIVDTTDYRDLRLGILVMQSTIAEEGTGLRMSSIADADDWFDKMTNILESLKRGRRFLLPLPVVLDREQSNFHVLLIYDGICRLLVLYHGFWEARTSVGHIPLGEPWHEHFRPRGINVVADWGRDMIQTAESILVYTLQTDIQTLGSAPDIFFVMISLAAGYVLGVKFLMGRTPGGGGRLLGAGDLLLKRIVGHLEKAVPERRGEHMAQKCVALLKKMLFRWEHQQALGLGAGAGAGAGAAAYGNAPLPDLGYTLAASSSPFSTEPSNPSASPSGSYTDTQSFSGLSEQHVPPELDFSLFLDSSLSMDARFWDDLQQSQALSGGYLSR